jgi:hypothetical protein
MKVERRGMTAARDMSNPAFERYHVSGAVTFQQKALDL